MNTEFLRELYEKGYFSIHNGFDHWHDAIHACIRPLVADRAVKESYGDSIIAAVDELGPYICISPDLCIPHALDTGEVLKTSICFMKSNRPVVFDEQENHQPTVFFALASNDTEAHLKQMKKLMRMLEQDELVEAIVAARTKEDFERLIYNNEQ